MNRQDAACAPSIPLDVDAVPAAAFVLDEPLAVGAGSWHVHARAQLLYASAGALRLETAGGVWLLPPQRAAWIAPGERHAVHVQQPAQLRTAYLRPDFAPRAPSGPCTVFSLPALGRELFAFAARWGPERDEVDAVADRFFAVLADCCADWADHALPLWLPRPEHPGLQRAVAAIEADLEGASLHAAARAAGMSERSFERHLHAEAGIGFRTLLQTARLCRALELLAAPEQGAEPSITDVAFAVGYGSSAAFSHAFRGALGESPRAWRKRLAGMASLSPRIATAADSSGTNR